MTFLPLKRLLETPGQKRICSGLSFALDILCCSYKCPGKGWDCQVYPSPPLSSQLTEHHKQPALLKKCSSLRKGKLWSTGVGRTRFCSGLRTVWLILQIGRIFLCKCLEPRSEPSARPLHCHCGGQREIPLYTRSKPQPWKQCRLWTRVEGFPFEERRVCNSCSRRVSNHCPRRSQEPFLRNFCDMCTSVPFLVGNILKEYICKRQKWRNILEAKSYSCFVLKL